LSVFKIINFSLSVIKASLSSSLSISFVCVCVRACVKERETQLVDMLKQDSAVMGCYTPSASKHYTTVSKSFHISTFAIRMANSNSAALCYFVLQYFDLLSQRNEFCSHNSSIVHHSECLFLCMLSAVSDFLMADRREQHISI
jgi:hypothetical protein